MRKPTLRGLHESLSPTLRSPFFFIILDGYRVRAVNFSLVRVRLEDPQAERRVAERN